MSDCLMLHIVKLSMHKQTYRTQAVCVKTLVTLKYLIYRKELLIHVNNQAGHKCNL